MLVPFLEKWRLETDGVGGESKNHFPPVECEVIMRHSRGSIKDMVSDAKPELGRED